MANPNKAFGFKPVKYLNGADWDGRGNVYFLSKNNTAVLRVGDPVTKDVTLANIDSAHGLPGCKLASSGDLTYGVCVAVGTNYMGPYINPTDLTKNYAPATKTVNYYALVVDDPNVIYEIQEASGAVQLSAAHIGCNQIFVADTPATTLAAGQTISGYQLGSYSAGTPAATATLDVRILGLAQRSDNAIGAYAKWLVKLNYTHFLTATGAAVAA